MFLLFLLKQKKMLVEMGFPCRLARRYVHFVKLSPLFLVVYKERSRVMEEMSLLGEKKKKNEAKIVLPKPRSICPRFLNGFFSCCQLLVGKTIRKLMGGTTANCHLTIYSLFYFKVRCFFCFFQKKKELLPNFLVCF